MRRQFVRTVEGLLDSDERLVLVLGDIGVFGFREAFERHPDRVYNIGILEQATISLAAGLSREHLIPIVHTIAPFAIERCFEQIKDDLCYQRLSANIVSVGASYDYAALGCTHHCPGDVGMLKSLPGMEVLVPGTPGEFDALFQAAHADGNPSYFRLSERSNGTSLEVEMGRANLLRSGADATVIAIGPTLDAVLAATEGLDVSVLYYTTMAPFDREMLAANCPSGKVFAAEPFYEGTIAADVMAALGGRPVSFESAGVPRRFLTGYGTAEDHDREIGMTARDLRTRLVSFIDR